MTGEPPTEPSGVPVDSRPYWSVVPWERGDWHGRIVALDEAVDVSPPERQDVAAVLAYGCSDERWDGDVAGIARLHDGTYIGWETFYGPTGDGFSLDAYGGGADIFHGSSWGQMWAFALTDLGRELVEILGQDRP